jgi:two-component system response regulator AtoC
MFETRYKQLFSASSSMRALLRKIERVADTTATVLIRGESGVGKEVVARAIHHASRRHAHPLVKVNCAALPAELLESEMFGHEKGAFTGAYRRQPGKFELAAEGTIFLDEIGDMPVQVQAKLLHVLQDHEFMRVGGSEMLSVDIRVIAATNRELEPAVRAGQFREDLYYRLKVINLFVPPLRERREEIPMLAQNFVSRFNQEFDRQATLSPEALAGLRRHAWPGNVRELENLMKSYVVLADQNVLHDMPNVVPEPPPASPPPASKTRTTADNNLREIGRRAATAAQREAIEATLEEVRWNRAEAARRLGISYKALLYKIDQCGLARKRSRLPRDGESLIF